MFRDKQQKDAISVGPIGPIGGIEGADALDQMAPETQQPKPTTPDEVFLVLEAVKNTLENIMGNLATDLSKHSPEFVSGAFYATQKAYKVLVGLHKTARSGELASLDEDVYGPIGEGIQGIHELPVEARETLSRVLAGGPLPRGTHVMVERVGPDQE